VKRSEGAHHDEHQCLHYRRLGIPGPGHCEGAPVSPELDSLLALTDGIHSWDVRLVVATRGGGEHESRMHMALPVPEPEAAEETGDER
jgi:hypothetical protein